MLLDIFHDSHNAFFRQPFGAVTCGERVTLRLGVRTHILTRAWIRLWKEGCEERILMLPVPGAEVDAGEDSVFFEGSFAAPENPGLLWYYFFVEVPVLAPDRLTRLPEHADSGDKEAALTDERWRSFCGFKYYYGNNGRRLGGIGALAGSAYCASFEDCEYVREPPAYQITVSAVSNKVPQWYKQGIMYQIFVDRFHRGGEPRWREVAPGRKGLFHLDWYDTAFYLRNERGGIDRWLFFGGNLDGVRAKLDYLRSLGVTVLYLNPIFEATSSHKYDTADYHEVDPLFGDKESFRALVEAAEEAGMAVLLDGVFSHTGADSRYFNREGFYPELGAYQSMQSKYARWYCFQQYPHVYSSWWGIGDLPNVNEMEPSYLDFICRGPESVIRSWMRLGVRGWRLDVADELPDEFIREVRAAMMEEDADSMLIGEVWEDASNKVSYDKMRDYFAGDELQGTMNYPFRALLLDFMLFRGSAYDLCAGLMSLYENYPRENFLAAMNLLGSHDVCRVLTLLGDPPGEEVLSEAEKRDYRLPAGSRMLAVNRLNMLVLWQMAFPGVPSIYYGDEAGMEGFRDPFNRGPYPWGREDQAVLHIFRRWTALRREYALLREGELRLVYAGADLCGFWRFWPEEMAEEGDSPAAPGLSPRLPARDERILVLINRSEAVLRYSVGGRAQEDEQWPRPCWEQPPSWTEADGWEVIDLDSGHRERPDGWGESGFDIAVPALAVRVLLFRPVRERVQPAWMRRVAGVLLPVASLPSRYGVGGFGREAYEFVDVLAEAGQRVWHILPLNPLDSVNSPYQSAGAMAISPLYICPDRLAEGLAFVFPDWDTAVAPDCSDVASGSRIDYEADGRLKTAVLRSVFSWLMRDGLMRRAAPGGDFWREYDVFRLNNADWVEDYALFCALKDEADGLAWPLWEKGLRVREEEALAAAQLRLGREIEYYVFEQFIAHRQFMELRAYANGCGVFMMGDLPFYVAADSADCWMRQEMFRFKDGRAMVVAGVPPDAFSEDGQRWGNPIYRWDAMARDDYSWWRARLRRGFELFDFARLDHFRGLAAYWEIPEDKPTARDGLWMKGPGRAFFEMMDEAWRSGIVAEDLGFYTPEVKILRDIAGIPGMKVLQFEEGKTDVEENVVFFSGTHDNDTLRGWLTGSEQELRDKDIRDQCRGLMERMYASLAGLVILPVQDILSLDSRARMNVPGTCQGNWEWKMTEDDLRNPAWEWLREMALGSGRFAEPAEE